MLPTRDDVERARATIGTSLARTPLLQNRTLGARLKCELFQRTGSFKVRGALNKIRSLTEEEKRRGVIAISAGNHAQAVAYAAAAEQLDALVVMWQGASAQKIEATRGVRRDGRPRSRGSRRRVRAPVRAAGADRSHARASVRGSARAVRRRHRRPRDRGGRAGRRRGGRAGRRRRSDQRHPDRARRPRSRDRGRAGAESRAARRDRARTCRRPSSLRRSPTA